MWAGRPRPHQAHIALEYAPKLRQLVEAVFAQEAAERRHPWVLFYFEHRSGHLILSHQLSLPLIRIALHGRELVTGEFDPFAADYPPGIKDRQFGRGDLDRQGDQGEQRKEDHEQHGRDKDIDEPL